MALGDPSRRCRKVKQKQTPTMPWPNLRMPSDLTKSTWHLISDGFTLGAQDVSVFRHARPCRQANVLNAS
eukprot:10998735-Alexandrium_andersonii.AAC.1